MSQSLLSLNEVLPPERRTLSHLSPTFFADSDCCQISLFLAFLNGKRRTPRPIALGSDLSMKGLTRMYNRDLYHVGRNSFPIQISPSPLFFWSFIQALHILLKVRSLLPGSSKIDLRLMFSHKASVVFLPQSHSHSSQVYPVQQDVPTIQPCASQIPT